MKWLNNFYLKAGAKSLIILSIMYAYSICYFYWGNHDWIYLKDKATLSDGFFEARYSMQLFNILFSDGHILPVFVIFLLEVGFVFFSIISGLYLGFDKKSKEFLLFVLLVGVFPYNLIVSYYLFIAVPLIWWAVFGVLLLFLTENSLVWWRFICGVLGYTLLLGSYPPNVALIMVLFCAKQIVAYVIKNEAIKTIIKRVFWWLGQFLCGCVLFKVIATYVSGFEGNMYNVGIYNFNEILNNVAKELLMSIYGLFLLKSELGLLCVIFLITILMLSCFWVLLHAKNKLFVAILIIAMLVASRFMFLVSPSSSVASFRGGYWGVLGLLIFALVILNLENKLWFRNCLFVFEVVFLLFFIRIDIEAQKTKNLLFKSDMKFNERLKVRIEENENYDKNNTYMSLSLGSKSNIEHFCVNGCDGYKNEILSPVAMSMDLIPLMFFDDEEYKIHTKLGIWSNYIWNIYDEKFFSPDALMEHEISSDENDVKSWIYMKAKPWPHKDSIYIDRGLILLLLDDKKVYVDAKLFLNYLKENR